MLDLQAGVHFEKEELVAIDQEFNGSGASVVDGPGCPDGGFKQAVAHACVKSGGRGLFNDLLVAALAGTVALEQVHHVAVAVAKNLGLDMPWARQVAFQNHAVIAKRAERLE